MSPCPNRLEGLLVSRLFVNLSTGPENPTKAALALLVARAALASGHEVDVLFAGDAVSLLRPATLDALHGVGTGSLREHFDALASGGARLFGSRFSSSARAIDAEAIGGAPVELVTPDRKVELIFEADRVVSY
jgi:predicted peroxiredoxin